MQECDELVLVSPARSQRTIRGAMPLSVDGFHWQVATDQVRRVGDAVDHRASAVRDNTVVADGYVSEQHTDRGVVELTVAPDQPDLADVHCRLVK